MGMKTAISVPDPLFAEAERLVRRSGRSRSEVYSAAIREYLARHTPDDITQALDRVAEQLGDPTEENRFIVAAARHRFQSSEW